MVIPSKSRFETPSKVGGIVGSIVISIVGEGVCVGLGVSVYFGVEVDLRSRLPPPCKQSID